MFSKINIFFLWHFLTKSKHPMTLKIKDKKLVWRNCMLDNFITRKCELQGSFCVTRIRIRVTQKDRIQINNTGINRTITDQSDSYCQFELADWSRPLMAAGCWLVNRNVFGCIGALPWECGGSRLYTKKHRQDQSSTRRSRTLAECISGNSGLTFLMNRNSFVA